MYKQSCMLLVVINKLSLVQLWATEHLLGHTTLIVVGCVVYKNYSHVLFVWAKHNTDCFTFTNIVTRIVFVIIRLMTSTLHCYVTSNSIQHMFEIMSLK